MHSSRIRTARSTGRLGGGLHQAQPGDQTLPGAGPLPVPDTHLPPGAGTPPLLTESQTPVKI